MQGILAAPPAAAESYARAHEIRLRPDVWQERHSFATPFRLELRPKGRRGMQGLSLDCKTFCAQPYILGLLLSGMFIGTSTLAETL